MRNNLSIIKGGAYVIDLDDQKSKRTHQISLFIKRNTAVYFDSLGIEYVPRKVLNRINDKPVTHNIFRIQDNDSIKCGYYC